MKTLNKALLTLVAGTFLSMGAQAAVTDMAGQPYVGAKVGAFMPDDGGADIDNATAFGVYGGYNFNDKVGVEAEYLGSSDADINDAADSEYNIRTYGLYATYRYNFENTPLFAKGKLGFANNEVDVSDSINGNEKFDDTAFAGGIALGYTLSPMVDMQAEFAMVGGDVESNILTLGANYKF